MKRQLEGRDGKRRGDIGSRLLIGQAGGAQVQGNGVTAIQADPNKGSGDGGLPAVA